MIDNLPPGFRNCDIVEAHRHREGSWVVTIEQRLITTRYIVRYMLRADRRCRAITPHRVDSDCLTRDEARDLTDELLYKPLPHYAKKWKSARVRDVQRERVYRWEDNAVHPSFASRSQMTLDEIRELTAEVYARFAPGKALPKILPYKGRGACANRYYMKFSETSRYRTVVLHEIAHTLDSEARHGPAFVRNYIDLLVCYEDMDRDHLMATAADHGVKVL